jgi:hypothetical protein
LTVTKLRVSIVGRTSPDCKDEDNPFIYFRDDRVQDAVLYVASEFPARASLYDWYKEISGHLDNLFRVGALREEDGKVYVNFTLNTRPDYLLIRDVTWRYSKLLVQQLKTHWPLIEESIRGCCLCSDADDDISKYLFLSVGFFALDWGCLGLLKSLGYMSGGKEQTGGRFTLHGQEVIDQELKGIYWGGHADFVEGMILLSFGDHAKARLTLPDLFWGGPLQAPSKLDSPETRRLAKSYTDILKRDTVRLLRVTAMNSGEDINGDGDKYIERSTKATDIVCPRDDLVAWLESIGYIKNGDISVPYFTAADAHAVQRLRAVVFGAVRDWCEQYYRQLKSDLSGLTALRHGVDYQEVFVDLWHWVFGFANKQLAEAGYIFDPYEPGHITPGCLGGIAEDALLDNAGAFSDR